MAYTPTEWKNGDKVTSAKLNNIEQGIVANDIYGDAFVVHTTQDGDNIVAVESVADIAAAVAAGTPLKMSINGVVLDNSESGPTDVFFVGSRIVMAFNDAEGDGATLVFMVFIASLSLETGIVTVGESSAYMVDATVMPMGG